jgi:hypothetical protein
MAEGGGTFITLSNGQVVNLDEPATDDAAAAAVVVAADADAGEGRAKPLIVMVDDGQTAVDLNDAGSVVAVNAVDGIEVKMNTPEDRAKYRARKDDDEEDKDSNTAAATTLFLTSDEVEDAFVKAHEEVLKKNEHYYVPDAQELRRIRSSDRLKRAWKRISDFFTQTLFGRLLGIVLAAAFIGMCYIGYRNIKTFKKREWYALGVLCLLIIGAVASIMVA